MHLIIPKVALYYHTLGLRENERLLIQQTARYCLEQNYEFAYLYRDTGIKKPLFRQMKEAMQHGGFFNILCIPSLLQTHCTHPGHTLQFLMMAQQYQTNVICLLPQPTNLFQQGLTLSEMPISKGTFNLGDVVRYLRMCNRNGKTP